MLDGISLAISCFDLIVSGEGNVTVKCALEGEQFHSLYFAYKVLIALGVMRLPH